LQVWRTPTGAQPTREPFFGGVDRNRFDFVGCVEALDRDLPRFMELIGQRLDMPTENVTPAAAIVPTTRPS
jgi:hypothetical protein